jgi:hypothetical protein
VGTSHAPRGAPLKTEVRLGLLVLAGWLLALGASLFLLAEETDRYFSWTIEPPLTAAFFGVLYWSGCLLALLCAFDRDWTHTRPLIGPVLTVTILLLVATLIHIERFHMDSVTGWLWVTLYAGLVPVTVFLVARQRRDGGGDPPRTAPFPGWFTWLLVASAAGALLFGAALFVVPEEIASIWPWPLTALTARAIGAWGLGGAVLLALLARERDWVRARPALVGFAFFGALELVALARYAGTLDWDKAAAWIYLAFLVGTIAFGAFGWLMATRTRARDAAVPGARATTTR